MNPNLNTYYAWHKIYGWNEANCVMTKQASKKVRLAIAIMGNEKSELN
jgi:hypothetical protein